jgi:hypothetical protein
VDAGRPTYTLQTFGPDRYDIWTMQSGWHNVPVIDGREQPAGAEFAASGVEVSIADDTGFAAELSGAYPGVSSWRRSVRLERAAGRVIVSDAWTPGTSAHRTEVRLLLAGDVRVDGASAVVTPLDGARPVRISWPAGVDASLVVRELDDPVLSSVWGARLTRLDLDVTSRDSVAVTVELDQTNAEGAR